MHIKTKKLYIMKQPFYIFITGEINETEDGVVCGDIQAQRGGNLPDQDALIVLASSIKAIVEESKEDIDLGEAFSIIKN